MISKTHKVLYLNLFLYISLCLLLCCGSITLLSGFPDSAENIVFTQTPAAQVIRNIFSPRNNAIITKGNNLTGNPDKDIIWSFGKKLQLDETRNLKGEKIIAPGRPQTYNLSLINKADTSLDFTLNIAQTSKLNIPLRIKLMQEDVYLLGDADTWVDLSDPVTVTGTLKDKAADDLTLIWEWAFYVSPEQDQIDTAYGLKGTDYVICSLDLNISAEESDTKNPGETNRQKGDNTQIKDSGQKSKTGKTGIIPKTSDDVNLLFTLFVLLLNFPLLVKIHKRKEDSL